MDTSRPYPASRPVVGDGRFTGVPRRAPCLRRRAAHRRSARPPIFAATLFAAVLVSCVALAASARAGSWTLPEDTGSLKIDTSRQATAESNNRAVLEPRSEQFDFKPTIEYGLTDRLTMGVNNEYQLVKSGLETERTVRTDGFVNTELFLRGRLRDQDWYRVSVQDLVHLPGEEDAPRFSQADSSLRVQYGRSGRLGGGTWTSSIQSGFHPALDETPDKLQMDLTFGWHPDREWQFTVQSSNTIGLDSEGGSVPDGIDAATGQLSVVRYFGHSLSLQVAGWQTVSGDDSGHSNGVDAVMWLRY